MLFTQTMLSHGQDSSSGEQLKQLPEPIYLINSNIIGNGALAQLNAKNIKETVVYKSEQGPGIFRNLTPAGILAITYNGPVVSESFADVVRQHKLQGPVSFVINGRKLSAAQTEALRIMPAAIGKLQVISPTVTTDETVINIQLAKAEATAQQKSVGTTPHVMIR